MEPHYREGNKRKLSNDGRVFETYRASCIGHFGFFGADSKLSICVAIKVGPVFKTIEANKLEDVARIIWKKCYKSHSCSEKFTRRFYSHRAWIEALIVSVNSFWQWFRN